MAYPLPAQQTSRREFPGSCMAAGIRVGPVWTPLIPSTFPEERVEKFGQQVPMGRAAQPDEIAPSYVFFAAPQLSSYYSGEVLAPIGGETLPG
jgi:NAD(P)-dependent dehydrogenase (short-subunit alcohol dehydrogenase family)